jgi:hypothetical protein
MVRACALCLFAEGLEGGIFRWPKKIRRRRDAFVSCAIAAVCWKGWIGVGFVVSINGGECLLNVQKSQPLR